MLTGVSCRMHVSFVCRDGHIYFADLEPSAEVLAHFRFGGDNGIMSLELLSIALGDLVWVVGCVWDTACTFSLASGISVFADMIAGRNVIIYSDNTGGVACLATHTGFVIFVGVGVGAEAATRKGTTKNFDQHSLVHCMWKRFAELRVGVWVLRVPTDDNIADCPSRFFPLHATLCVCRRLAFVLNQGAI